MSQSDTLLVRTLGLQAYTPIWQAMQSFTDKRTSDTTDEIWLLEHEPIFTLGRNAKKEHILSSTHIPLIDIDRGGQVTYHGPGQLIIYLMIDIKRRALGVRKLVSLIEQSIITTLNEYQLKAYAKKEAPGVYIGEAKIAALGLRIKKGCSFHGLSLNVAMNLDPFKQINPCGYKNLEVIQLCDYIEEIQLSQVQQKLTCHLSKNLGYDVVIWKEGF
ncbi:MAG: lipoyl(octanoyl) transferase LipB [gamma proteobacterium symbiont of Lucinoma myriamae]|nr:lipoyl(octanoyl) transferase LipB [gamma proteobacterium symbiont of Lucinoma myriamae]MCU7817663.1 lipoyl(octanoyl) transferase LipB [gamma proteobacterium symbiont of Lucinoma myriamae]MCU7831871.1 lipoyl(octanoyl) transferase LipB [gamma proteobacterium symbiont of Lucinoma myriamae]